MQNEVIRALKYKKKPKIKIASLGFDPSTPR